MKRRNRQVYRELEKRSALLDDVVRYVEPLIARVEELEAEKNSLEIRLSLLVSIVRARLQVLLEDIELDAEAADVDPDETFE